MSYLEVSKKISLAKAIKPEDIKQILVHRLGKAYVISSISDNANEFSVSASTGPVGSFSRHTKLKLDVQIESEGKICRILVSGKCSISKSLLLYYFIAFIALLMAGLLPGSIETGFDQSDALDALVFLIFGVFLSIDINRKLREPKEFIETILESINTLYG
jgi:hypothetical protein